MINDKVYFNYRRCFISTAIVHYVGKLIFRKKIIKQKISKEDFPCIVIANHSSNLDFACITPSIFPKPLSIVVAEKIFFEKGIPRDIIRNLGYIPKKLFNIDINCIRTIKDYLDNGISIGIFPEGKVSSDGSSSYIMPAISKLLKILKRPVIVCHTQGSHLNLPKANERIRIFKGKIETHVYKLFTKVDLTEMDNDTIYKKICNALSYNDYLYQSTNRIKLKDTNLCENLQLTLYQCPKCYVEWQLVANGNELTCCNCGNNIRMNEYGELVTKKGDYSPSRVDLWWAMQKNRLITELDKVGTLEFDIITSTIDTTVPYYEQILLPLACNRGKWLPIDNDMIISEPIYDSNHRVTVYDTREFNLSADTVKLTKSNRASKVKYHINKKYGKGKIYIDKEKFIFKGIIDGLYEEISVKHTVATSLQYIPGEKVEWYDTNRIIHFFSPYATKIALVVETIFGTTIK